MQKPSDQWKRTRLATLARLQRTAFDPLFPIFCCHLWACVLFLIGFMHFSVFDQGYGYTIFTALLAICSAVAGALIPVLSGSVVALYFVNTRLNRLIRE